MPGPAGLGLADQRSRCLMHDSAHDWGFQQAGHVKPGVAADSQLRTSCRVPLHGALPDRAHTLL